MKTKKKPSKLATKSQRKDRKRSKKTQRQLLIEKLDELWRIAIKMRDGWRCRKSGVLGDKKSLNSHHIFSRTHYSTRWLIDNGITLTWAIHKNWVPKEPEEVRDWIISEIGEEKYMELKRLRYETVKYDIYDLMHIQEGLEAYIAALEG